MKTMDRLIGAYSSLIRDVSVAAQTKRELNRALRTMVQQQVQLQQVRSTFARQAVRIPQRRGVEIDIKRCIVQIEKLAVPTVSITPQRTRGIMHSVGSLLSVLPGDPDTPPPRRKKKIR